jgi:hypothetical protein
VVNNAGIGMRQLNPRFMTDAQPFWRLPPDGFRDVVDTKLVGCFLVARAMVPQLPAPGGGRIVNISMNTRTMVRPGFAPYGSSRRPSTPALRRPERARRSPGVAATALWRPRRLASGPCLGHVVQPERQPCSGSPSAVTGSSSNGSWSGSAPPLPGVASG